MTVSQVIASHTLNCTVADTSKEQRKKNSSRGIIKRIKQERLIKVCGLKNWTNNKKKLLQYCATSKRKKIISGTNKISSYHWSERAVTSVGIRQR